MALLVKADRFQKVHQLFSKITIFLVIKNIFFKYILQHLLFLEIQLEEYDFE